jgi:hypothetical protein
MPRSKRWEVKQVLDQAIFHLVKTMEYLERIAGEYKEPHPEISSALDSVCVELVDIAELIQSFRDKV